MLQSKRRGKNANSVSKFWHEGQLIGTECLLQLANRHQRDENMPPFALK
jgi:hypothetical protein